MTAGDPGVETAPMRRYPVWEILHEGPYDSLVDVLLANRSLSSADVSDSPEILHDPFELRDMEAAVERLAAAAGRSEPVLVFGDYDVDGVTSTALLLDYLERVGVPARPFLPDRLRDGYGMRPAALERAMQEGVRPGLIVTADNGIGSFEAIDQARGLGIDVIVIDHHLPEESLPEAVAVVNPNRSDCPYPFKGLAAVGVAFKVIQAASVGRLPEDERRKYLNSLLDLVALGTVADVAPMVGENRLLTRRGLQILRGTRRPGLVALKRAAGASTRIDTSTIGFVLGPRLNSAGRLASADLALRLVRCTSVGEATALAEELDRLNGRRQDLQESGVEEAIEQVESEGMTDARALVVRGDDWHLGVVGLIASRLADRYGRPVLACSGMRGGGLLTGSARSPRGYNLAEGLSRISDLLVEHGGHAAAAGFSLRAESYTALQERMAADAAEHIEPEDLEPTLTIDCRLDARDVSLAALDSISGLAPFGPGNERPRFLVAGCRVERVRTIGRDRRHLKLVVDAGAGLAEAVLWRRGDLAGGVRPGDGVDLACKLERNDFRGANRLQLVVDDLRPATSP